MVKITITGRGNVRGLPLEIEFSGKAPSDVKVDDIQSAIFAKLPSYYADRQRLTFDKKPLELSKSLDFYGIKDGDSIQFKDLGPQIAWQTVFLVEYAGPLLIHPLFFFGLQRILYGKTFEYSTVQWIAYTMVMVHYAKRELETIFVHRFSHGTMPVRNIFKNSFHYWVIGGAFLAYFVYGPWGGANSTIGKTDMKFVYFLTTIWVWAEFSNLWTHITLKTLRPKGTRKRAIPHGYGFNWVSCPNYFFESVAWLAFALLTRSLAAFVFLVVSAGQMWFWAVKKHITYKKEFEDYPKKRKIMIPFIA